MIRRQVQHVAGREDRVVDRREVPQDPERKPFHEREVALPCNEQLRAKDLALRIAVCAPAAVVCDPRNEAVLRASGWDGSTLWTPVLTTAGAPAPAAGVPAPADLAAVDPCLVTFTSGMEGELDRIEEGFRAIRDGSALKVVIKP